MIPAKMMAKYTLPQYTRGRGLDIGCGADKAFGHFIGIDNDPAMFGRMADICMEGDKLDIFADNSLDFVFASDVVALMPDKAKAVEEWWRVIKPEGHLCVFGSKEETSGLLDYIVHGYLVKEDVQFGDYWLTIIQKTDSLVPKPSGKRACVTRMGGFGDMLQTALVLPKLKKQGYRVYVLTTPKGMEIIKDDPNVDEFVLIDPNQVPNVELCEFWRIQATRYDLFVNLSESVEGTFLAIPGRPMHLWPHHVRHKMTNKNYFEFICDMAGVKFGPEQLFYPSLDEAEWCRSVMYPGAFNVVWALAGSSIHKVYPHQDVIISRMLLEFPKVRIFLVGDYACKILEQGWEEEPRVIGLSGEISIRKSLALAQSCQLVIGPETGVLNAVAYDHHVSKVVILSHSSPKNLTENWLMTQSMTPTDTPCYPCHMLHFTSEFCNCDDGIALCSYNTDPAKVWEAVDKVHKKWSRK